MSEKDNQSMHWADIMADKIIREKGDKPRYTCASGITPSGTVHIGNFREIITVELVARALREKGKDVRFMNIPLSLSLFILILKSEKVCSWLYSKQILPPRFYIC